MSNVANRKVARPDNRGEFLTLLHEEGAYDLPARGREEMCAEIAKHRMMRDGSGGKRFCWDIRMNFEFDKSGRLAAGEEVCETQDARWKRAVKTDPSILQSACDRAIAPYLVPGVEILGEPSMACTLEQVGGAGGWLVLDALAGRSLCFPVEQRVSQALADLDDAVIRDLWATLRIIDTDTSRDMRAFEVSWALNKIRADLEADWLLETDHELVF